MDTKQLLLQPGLHPAQILHALHLQVCVWKRKQGFPSDPRPLQELVQIWHRQPYVVDSRTAKRFGIVLGTWIPCTIHVIPGQMPSVQVTVAAFDEYYGTGACCKALWAYLADMSRQGYEATLEQELPAQETQESLVQALQIRSRFGADPSRGAERQEVLNLSPASLPTLPVEPLEPRQPRRGEQAASDRGVMASVEILEQLVRSAAPAPRTKDPVTAAVLPEAPKKKRFWK